MYISMTRTTNFPMHTSHAKFFGGWGASPAHRLDEEAMAGFAFQLDPPVLRQHGMVQ